jgi:putative iron-dependent peroxidase
MNNAQPGILSPPPVAARYLVFRLTANSDPAPALAALGAAIDGDRCVLGLGASLISTLGTSIDGLHEFPTHAHAGIDVPSTPAALWLWLRGNDHGELLHQGRELEKLLAPTFRREQAIDAFRYGDGRDLSGYIDGTENPEGDKALETGLVHGAGPGLDGSSFVAVQQWLHNLDCFQAMSQQQQDHAIGRRIADNEEIADAPASAHVKRTAQEDFTPEAFVLRRSMPWTCSEQAGLVFVAFGYSTAAFEALLRRMVGADDGIVDALFEFTRPLTGAYFWCPPMKNGALDLSILSTG